MFASIEFRHDGVPVSRDRNVAGTVAKSIVLTLSPKTRLRLGLPPAPPENPRAAIRLERAGDGLQVVEVIS
jgi:hypothetical protein